VNKLEKMECPRCHKNVTKAGYSKHQKTKKCLTYIDKTDSAKKTNFATSPRVGDSPGVESESHSKILTEINMKKEFDKMAEKFKGGGSDAEKEKKYKYKCGECGEYFNIPAEGSTCPFCGK